jgi:gas vesicle protein
LKEQYDCLRSAKDQEEQELKDYVAKLKDESSSNIDTLKSQKEELEENL